MLQYAHGSHKLVGNMNSSFLALIPKGENPSTFNRFMPISLCNSSYKFLTKIIVVRLTKIFPKVIFANQSSFMCNRHIIDNIC
jgi:hypothetical protein